MLEKYCFFIPKTYWCDDAPLSRLAPDIQTGLTLSDLVNHLEEIRLGLAQQHLLHATEGKIGLYSHSLFSAIAFHYAASYPGSILFIEGEAPCPFTTEKWPEEKTLFFTNNASIERQQALAREGIPPSGSTVDEKSLGNFSLFLDAYEKMSPTVWFDFKQDHRLIWGEKQLNMCLYKHVFTTLFHNYDCRTVTAKVHCPVHLSLGLFDTAGLPPYVWIDPEEKGGLGFFKKGNREYYVFERSGHWPATEEPHVFCMQFNKFINDNVVPHLPPSTREQIAFAEEKELSSPRSRL